MGLYAVIFRLCDTQAIGISDVFDVQRTFVWIREVVRLFQTDFLIFVKFTWN